MRARLVRLGIGIAVAAALLIGASPASAQVNGAINHPGWGGHVAQPFTLSGWAIDAGGGTGPGIGAVHVYGCLWAECHGWTFWGEATYGLPRPDVAAMYGSSFLPSGYALTKSGLAPGEYYVQVRAYSTVTGNWLLWAVIFTVVPSPEHVIDTPTVGQGVSSPVTVSGWAIDAAPPSGTGVDEVHVSTYPRPGSGTAPYFIGLANYGLNRPDVAAAHGEQFRYSGYSLSTSGLTPAGPHLLAVTSHNVHTQTWTTRTRLTYVDSPTNPLTITRGGTGTGGVTATGLSCPGGSPTQGVPCGASYPLGTQVTLTAVPDPGSTFDGWIGVCSGTGTCQVTLNGPQHVSAVFSTIPGSIATRYYHTDVIGSVRAITDETGAVVIRHDYRPFGEDTQPLTGDPMRFAGKELDPETGLQYFNARYYRNLWGRFTTVDPVHVGAALTNPQRWNRYAYAGNNPLRYVDPSGLAYQACTDVNNVGSCSWYSDTDFWTAMHELGLEP